jgi:DNA polymerase III subunit beta
MKAKNTSIAEKAIHSITINSKLLKKELTIPSKVVATNPVLPILEYFLFTVKGDSLTVTASDMHLSIISTINVQCATSFSCCVPAKILMETLDALPDQPINIVYDDVAKKINIISDGGNFKISTEDSGDYLKINSNVIGHEVTINTQLLLKSFEATAFATSSDDLRPAMRGVLMDMRDYCTKFVATDGHMLSMLTAHAMNIDLDQTLNIHRKAINLISSCIGSEESVRLSWNGNMISFEWAGVRMLVKKIEESFPTYEMAIPKPDKLLRKVEMDRYTLIAAIKRMFLYTDSNKTVALSPNRHGQIVIESKDSDYLKEAKETWPCKLIGEPITIGFNAKFLLACLERIPGDDVVMDMTNEGGATIIRPKVKSDEMEYLMLVMPVILNN